MPLYTPATTAVRQVFVTGLQNAHAVEQQSLALIDRQLDRLIGYPGIAERLRAHRSETEGQIRRLEQILGSLGESHSGWRDAAMALMGNLATLGNAMAGDEVLRNHIVNHAFENFEIATYTSLIALAEAGDFATAVPLLEASLAEEQAMAAWVLGSLADITLKYVGRSA
jgi:ferritin-like metal-binding protein YciE